MNHKFRSMFMAIPCLVVSLACGGGGGGSGAATTQDNTKDSSRFFSVRYTESTLNNPTLVTATGASVDTSGLTGLTSGDAALKGAARASVTETVPEFLLYLKMGTASATPSGKYNAMVYGLHNTQVSTGQYVIDFTTDASPDVRQTGITNANSVAMKAELPSDIAFGVSTGAVTWGSWTGGIDADANTLLLAKGKLFLLASKVTTHTRSEIESKTFDTTINILQSNDDSNTTQFTVASGAGPINFNATNVGPTTAYVFTRTNQNVTLTTGLARPYRLNSSDTSLVEISDTSSFTSLTEQGFLGASNFHVLINPDNTQRPSVSIVFK